MRADQLCISGGETLLVVRTLLGFTVTQKFTKKSEPNVSLISSLHHNNIFNKYIINFVPCVDNFKTSQQNMVKRLQLTLIDETL